MTHAYVQATLPIDFDDWLVMPAQEARSLGELLASDYVHADPFPHIVIDAFLPEKLVTKIEENFPSKPNSSDVLFEDQYTGHHKRQVFPNDCNGFNRELFAFFNSESMLQFLEGVSGISGILPDPYFSGGGFHEISRGGLLGIHADFRIHEELNLQRRLNMLIYLNRDWDDAWGGQLELWDRSMSEKVQSVSPILNRCVIFNTDADSFHGHPDPLNCPSDVTRKSIALYYYTASKRVYDDVPGLGTMYQARPGDCRDNRAQAFKTRVLNYSKEWLPPILFRRLRQLKSTIDTRHSDSNRANS